MCIVHSAQFVCCHYYNYNDCLFTGLTLSYSAKLSSIRLFDWNKGYKSKLELSVQTHYLFRRAFGLAKSLSLLRIHSGFVPPQRFDKSNTHSLNLFHSHANMYGIYTVSVKWNGTHLSLFSICIFSGWREIFKF